MFDALPKTRFLFEARDLRIFILYNLLLSREISLTGRVVDLSLLTLHQCVEQGEHIFRGEGNAVVTIHERRDWQRCGQYSGQIRHNLRWRLYLLDQLTEGRDLLLGLGVIGYDLVLQAFDLYFINLDLLLSDYAGVMLGFPSSKPVKAS